MMRVRNRLARWVPNVLMVLVLGVGAGNALAQPESASERLQRLTAENSLATVDAKPWHLKMDVTAFDDAGANPETGTIEVWKSGADMRTSFTFKGVTATRMQAHGVIFHSEQWLGVPYRAEQALSRVLNPGPDAPDLERTIPDQRKQNFGKVSLECIMLSPPIKHDATAPLGLYPTYCTEPAKDAILLSYNYGGEAVILRASGKFLDHIVPMKLDIQEGSIIVVRTAITALNIYEPVEDEFVPGPEMKSGSITARVAGGVIAGSIINKVPPVYPESAKREHVGGTVVLHAIIGRDGHVHGLRPVSSPYPDLTISAIAAVRQWTYKPYLLNGEPTEVDTTITVNYNLNRF